MGTDHLTVLRDGLRPGENKLLARRERTDIGVDFAVHVLEAGQTLKRKASGEEHSALIIGGRGSLSLTEPDGARRELAYDRPDWIEVSPFAVHGATGSTIEIAAETRTEVAVMVTDNDKPFPGRLYSPSEVSTEHRGRGILEDTAYRWVRLVFDRTIAPEAARLVLGEVITLPGRWSSYPPHHHKQPEIYYYRFSPSHGYGHGELGDEVFKLQEHDLLCITAGRDHAQVAAPGYHMYYLWAIRHLEGDPYAGFEYAAEHAGLLKGVK
jgi:5-deoxy-glucuronate isomerase